MSPWPSRVGKPRLEARPVDGIAPRLRGVDRHARRDVIALRLRGLDEHAIPVASVACGYSRWELPSGWHDRWVQQVDQQYLSYLEKLDLSDFARKARAFWLDPPTTESVVFDRFMEVVQVSHDELAASAALHVEGVRLPAGHTLWRVRGLTLPIDGGLFPEMNCEADLWEAPARLVTSRGRLNSIGESVLYTSIGDPVVAVREARVAHGKRLALIRYQTAVALNLVSIAADATPAGIPDALKSAHIAVTSFYRDVFTREFDGSNNLTYVVSNRLAKDWLDLPPDVADGWSFPSIVHGAGLNAAFRPHVAHRVLRMAGVAIGEAVESPLLGHQLRASMFSPGIETPGEGLRWFPMGSTVQRARFPEFI